MTTSVQRRRCSVASSHWGLEATCRRHGDVLERVQDRGPAENPDLESEPTADCGESETGGRRWGKTFVVLRDFQIDNTTSLCSLCDAASRCIDPAKVFAGPALRIAVRNYLYVLVHGGDSMNRDIGNRGLHVCRGFRACRLPTW